jgi:hypothetical protein
MGTVVAAATDENGGDISPHGVVLVASHDFQLRVRQLSRMLATSAASLTRPVAAMRRETAHPA